MKQKDLIAELRRGLEIKGNRAFWSEFFKNVDKASLERLDINKHFNKSDVIEIASKLSPFFNKEDSRLFSFGASLFLRWKPWFQEANKYEESNVFLELDF